MTTPARASSPLLSLLLALAPAPALAQESAGDPWPQWRGPTRDGRDSGPAWPAELTEERVQPLWRVELGPSYAGPVVVGGRVFSVETEDEEHEVVRAFDRSSGVELWQTRWEGAMEVPFFAASRGSWVRATPACDGESLFVAGMRDVLVCLDAATGEERWRVDFTERAGTPLPSFGFVCSPLVVGEHVYVQAGGAFVKLDKRTGVTVWRSMADQGGMMDGAFSSPVMAELHGVTQLVVQSRAELAGVRPQDGEVLWSTPIQSFRNMNILTPLVVGNTVFTSAYGGRGQLLQIDRGEDGFEVERAWDNRSQGYMTSPVVLDGHAYLFLRSNRFTCVELATGEVAWTSGPTGDEYWSLVLQGDRLLALADTGRLRLVQATPEEYRELGAVELVDGSSWAHLAVSGSQLFVRELNALSAFAWE